jgi:hypothetical protein
VGAFPRELEQVTTDIQVDGRWAVRVRVLTTAQAARAGVLKELLGVLVSSKPEERVEAARAAMDPDKLEKADVMVSRILCEVVEEGQMDGGEWEPLRFVATREQHDPEASPPRLWVRRLPGHVRGAIVGAALLHHAEAEGILRPFRGSAGRAPVAAQGGEELRPDAP